MSKDDKNPLIPRSDGGVNEASKIATSIAIKLMSGTVVSDDDWKELYVLHKGGAPIFSTFTTSDSKIARGYRDYLKRAAGGALSRIVTGQTTTTPTNNQSAQAEHTPEPPERRHARASPSPTPQRVITVAQGESYLVARDVCRDACKESLDQLVVMVDAKLAQSGKPFQARHQG